MSFRGPSYFYPSSRRMFASGNMLMGPWSGIPSELPLLAPFLGAKTHPFESSLMSTVLDILEPLSLLDRMIGRWIERPLLRRAAIRRRPRPFRFRRAIRAAIPQAQPVRRRRVQRIRRARPVSQPQYQQAMMPQRRQPSMGRRRPLSVSRRQRPVSAQRVSQPMWQQQPQFGRQISGISGGGVMRQPSIGKRQQQQVKQVPIQQQPLFGRQMSIPQQQKQKKVFQQPQQQQMAFPAFKRQASIKQTGGKPSFGRQMSIPQQQLGTKQQQMPFLGRQVSIQSGLKEQKQPTGGKQFPIQQQQGMTGGVTGQKLTKAAAPLSGVKLPQLYRICLNCQDCNTKDIKCRIQENNGQCNLIISGVGPYNRCYTLPRGCDCNKMKKYVTPQRMFVVECPLLEAPRCLDIATQPQVKANCVCLKVNIPEFIDPNKVQVNLKGSELIMRFETQLVTEECACRVHYYNKVTLPANVNFDMLKCVIAKGCLCITAPIIARGGAQQPVVGRGGIQEQPAKAEKKPRHRKTLAIQREQEQQKGVSQPQKGVKPTQKVSGGQQPVVSGQQQKKTQKIKLPTPEETTGISVGGGKKATRGKGVPSEPVTPSTTPTKPMKEGKKKQPTTKAAEAKPTKPTTTETKPELASQVSGKVKKEKKAKKAVQGGEEKQKGEISGSGSQRLHEIFSSGSTGTRSESPEHIEKEQSGRVSPPTQL